jgi:hypothetical protein
VAATVAKAEFSTVGAPTVSGSAVVGGTLTANPGTWAPSPGSLSYQWYAGTKAISKATGPTLTVAAAQAGAAVRVLVRATRPGYRTTEAYSPTVTIVPAP